jgi:putative ubiquitin-RnfH superfamily antitoxin RatB of RatAB toxin-antitoxin module
MPDRPSEPEDEVCVEVVQADSVRQIARTYRLTAPATVGAALAFAAGTGDFPGLEPDCVAVGIWGAAVGAAHTLKSGDRIEIYRPLVVDPKLERRRRAADSRRRR